MGVGLRLGGGLWVFGGGGLLLVGLPLLLARGMVTLAIWAVASAVMSALAVWSWHGSWRRQRMALLADALRGCIELDTDEELADGPPVCAVYAVGSDFHHGRHPQKGLALAASGVPGGHPVVRVAAFADRARAARAAALLRRHGFSFDEIRGYFPQTYRPGEGGGAAATQVHDNEDTTVSGTSPSSRPAGRDYTKYLFEGQTLGKRHLVLAVVQRYVREHPGIGFAELRGVFPDRLQAQSPTQFSAARNVVAKLADVRQQDISRYFTGPGETLSLADGPVVVSREWNLHNIRHVLEVAAQLGYEIRERPRA